MAAIYRPQWADGAAIYGPMATDDSGVVDLTGAAGGQATATGQLSVDRSGAVVIYRPQWIGGAAVYGPMVPGDLSEVYLTGNANGQATATGQLTVVQPGGFTVGNPYVERIPARSRVWTITKDLLMSLEKRSWEERLYDFDLSGLLAPSVTLVSVSAMVAEPADGTTPITFGTPAINGQPIGYTYATVPAGKVVQCRVSGGVERSYILRARCIDSNGEHVEGTVRLNVRDRP